MLGILKWGMAQIWWYGWALRKYNVKKSKIKKYIYLITEGRTEKPGMGGGLETPIHYWSLRPPLQLII